MSDPMGQTAKEAHCGIYKVYFMAVPGQNMVEREPRFWNFDRDSSVCNDDHADYHWDVVLEHITHHER
jgi:hypothetical protein